MTHRILIAVTIALLLFSCTSNKVQTSSEPVPAFTGTVTKVAILPLKAADSGSRNVVKIMSIRDLALAFNSHPKYSLLDMDVVAKQFKDSGFTNVDALEKEQLMQMTKLTGSDVVIIGNVSESRPGLFAGNTRFYRSRSDELKQHTFNVVTNRDQRLAMMQEDFLPELDRFISNEVDKLLNIAVQNYVTQKYEDAVRGFNSVIGLNPDKGDAYYYLGATYYKQEKYTEAEQNLEKAITLNTEDQRAQLMLIEMYEITKQTDKRLKLMEAMAVKNPDEELWLAIGNLYDEAGNKAKAKESFQKSLEINPDYSQALIRLSFMLFEEGDYVGAIPQLEKAADLFPDNQLVSDRLAASYFKANRLTEAITRYENILKSDPQNIQAYLTVAGLYRTQAGESRDSKVTNELNTKAITALNQAKKIDPENAMVYLNLAAIYLSQKKNSEAESNANTAIAKNPSLYQPYVILASVTQSKGTDQYNRFADLEKQAAKAVGKKANQLKKDRDAAKASALNFLRKAKEQLEAGRSRTTDSSALSDINSRISSINNMISQVQ
jgi:tetratricopeptide (TPR) repeat protein